ncbi:MAG TPA: FKBP-type peptidyl-prolyl cis-trans isomerase [Chitinophagaceae bacterium]|nr:FKBP-type peptidyl-prolyl cis-trans isomerase [Chitinophagaceae bacterium]
MKKSILLFTVAALIITGCNLSGYKRAKSGLFYKMIPSEKGKQLRHGQFVKMQVNGFIHDSAFFDTRSAMPYYSVVDSAGRPYDFSEILHLMKEGDSAVTIQLVDSLLKVPGIQLPPYFRKGDKIKTCLKIVKVFDSITVAQNDYNVEAAIFKEKEDVKNAAAFEKAKKELDDFIAKNKINATQTANGVFVEVKQAGTGASADSGKIVGVKYTGTLLDGTVFDSNTDANRKDTLKFAVSSGAMIPGFDEGIKGQKLGAKLKIYIPARYGYGAQDRNVIKPFSNLIFDLEVVEVKDPAPKPITPLPNSSK